LKGNQTGKCGLVRVSSGSSKPLLGSQTWFTTESIRGTVQLTPLFSCFTPSLNWATMSHALPETIHLGIMLQTWQLTS